MALKEEIYLDAVLNVDEDERGLVGLFRVDITRCNKSHMRTTQCFDCRWVTCQICNSSEVVCLLCGIRPCKLGCKYHGTRPFTGWMGRCTDHMLVPFTQTPIPDDWKQMVMLLTTPAVQPIAGPSASGTTSPVGSSSGGASSFVPVIGSSTGASGFVSVTGNSANASTFVPVIGSSTGPAAGSVVGGSSPQQQAGSIVGSTAEIIVIIDSDEEDPDGALLRGLKEKFPFWPDYWDIPASGNIREFLEVTIFQRNEPLTLKHADETIKCFQSIADARDFSVTIVPDPPTGFSRKPKNFTIASIKRCQNFPNLRKHMLAREEVKTLNDTRPDAEKATELYGIAFHGTDVDSARNICKIGAKGAATITHAYGVGVYYGYKNISLPSDYAFRKQTHAIVMGTLAIGRNGYSTSNRYSPPDGFDTGGCGNYWIVVAFEDHLFYPEYIFELEAASETDWDEQLRGVLDAGKKLKEEEEEKKKAQAAKADTTPKDDGGAAKDDDTPKTDDDGTKAGDDTTKADDGMTPAGSDKKGKNRKRYVKRTPKKIRVVYNQKPPSPATGGAAAGGPVYKPTPPDSDGQEDEDDKQDPTYKPSSRKRT